MITANKKKLGNRLECNDCGTKYYDLNRQSPTCPKCGKPFVPVEKPRLKAQKPVEIELEPAEELDVPADDLDILSFDTIEEDYQDINEESISE